MEAQVNHPVSDPPEMASLGPSAHAVARKMQQWRRQQVAEDNAGSNLARVEKGKAIVQQSCTTVALTVHLGDAPTKPKKLRSMPSQAELLVCRGTYVAHIRHMGNVRVALPAATRGRARWVNSRPDTGNEISHGRQVMHTVTL
eukprot:1158956-Pelagomonas_calceolata.AAC.10